jgi:branched-subunit amino acid ABC-type transport system permease component
MRSLLPFVITGFVTGSLYGLAGLGLVLTYRTSGVFNFGHGALGAGAAFLFYTLHVSHHVPWPFAVLITLIAFGVVGGWVMERITRRLGDVPEAVVVVTTVGILLAVEGYLFLQYGDVTRNFPEFLPTSGFTTQGVNISWAQVIAVIIATLSAILLYGFLRRSRLGIAMRAVVDNPTLVALSGENPPRVRQASWAIGSAFAALSGILLAPTLGLDANLLTLLVVQAFGACAIGMFSSLPLTYAGGIGIGVLASVATKYLTHRPFNGIPTAVPFLILLVVLLAVPVAKFPRRRASLRSLLPDVRPLSPKAAAGLAVGGLAVLLVVPAVVGAHLPVWIAGLTDVIIFSSLALLVWTSGQISLCHAAFVAVGAVAMGHLTTGEHLPWAVGLVLAGLITVPVGALVAIPAIRLSGLYLALATLGFGILMQDVIFPTKMMFGAQLSVTAARPHLGLFNGAHDKQFYYLVLGLALLCLAVMAWISRSRLGRLLRAMSETPTMLATHGLGVNMTRLIVFCISAFFAGVAGALVVTQFGSASGVGYGPIQSLIFLAVLAICGTRILRSSILAAGLLAVVPGYLSKFNVDRQAFAFGLVAIAAGIVIANRAGISAFFARSTSPSTSTVVRRPAHRPAHRPGAPLPARAPRSPSRIPSGVAR